MKILFVGCSFTAGNGLALERKDPNLWVNIFSKYFWPDANVNNVAMEGWSNESIFLEAFHQLITDTYDIAFIGWSYTTRINVNIGFELYDTNSRLTADNDINLVNNYKVTGKELEKIGTSFKKYRNLHWDILKLIKYVNYLKKIQEQQNNKIYFINTAENWKTDLFKFKSFNRPSELDDVTKEILLVEHRNDEEIKKLYEHMHSLYKKYGGINEHLWLNLDKSFRSMQIDNASLTDRHPGYTSNAIFANLLIDRMKNVIR